MTSFTIPYYHAARHMMSIEHKCSPIVTLLYWHTGGVFEEMFDVNIKVAQSMQNKLSWNFRVKSSLLKKCQTLAIIWEISYSNLETGRFTLKSGASWIIWESWQHWVRLWNGTKSLLCVLFSVSGFEYAPMPMIGLLENAMVNLPIKLKGNVIIVFTVIVKSVGGHEQGYWCCFADFTTCS